jgi:NAD(P)-dependent dehydrogenase (short-subunit alcohol dehydrogenase family)
MTMMLADKVALVTGAGDGIGKAVALHFAAEGARVAVLDLQGEAAQKTCGEIERQGGSGLALAADVGEPAAVQRALEELARRMGTLHILVNNAGIAGRKMFAQMTAADWQRVWDTNFNGALNCIRGALPLLKKQGGKIVNIASVEVFSHSRKLSAYSASKGALASLSRTLAVELAPDKITVNYICPGFIRTEMTRPYWQRWLFRRYILRVTPLGRMGESEDIAKVAAFLASSGADFVTGQGIVVDGGLTLRSL